MSIVNPVISLVIPGYNEAANVPRVVAEAVQAFEEQGIGYEIIQVDDGSTDDSFDVMQTLAKDDRIRALRHTRNRGLGAALRTGFEGCRGEYVSWLPADGQGDIRAVLDSLQLMESTDLVVGIRHVKRDIFRGLITVCFHLLIRSFFSFDPVNMCGFYTIRRSLLEQLSPTSENVFLNIEIPILCAKKGVRIRQISIDLKPRLSGTSKVANLRTLSKNVIEILRARFAR